MADPAYLLGSSPEMTQTLPRLHTVEMKEQEFRIPTEHDNT